jgi:hypothetical protein
MKRLCMFILAAVLLVSCTKEQNHTISLVNGKTVYYNKNVPAIENVEFEFTKLFEINNDSVKYPDDSGVNFPLYFQADQDGEIFIFDNTDYRIKKYDNEGKFLLAFGARGQGPGEYLTPSEIFLLENAVIVNDFRQKSLMVYNREGEFVEKKLINKTFTSITPSSENRYLCSSMYSDNFENKFSMITVLGIYDQSFNLVSEIKKSIYPIIENEVFNPVNFFYCVTIHKNRVFLSTSGINDYSIEVFDLDGNNIQKIVKSYFRHEMTHEDFTRERIFLNSFSSNDVSEGIIKHKNAISGIVSLNDQYLLVSTPKDTNDPEGIKYDIFKDNIFQKSVFLIIPVESELLPQIKIVGNRLYTIDRENNSLVVFKIEAIE